MAWIYTDSILDSNCSFIYFFISITNTTVFDPVQHTLFCFSAVSLFPGFLHESLTGEDANFLPGTCQLTHQSVKYIM